MAITINGTTGIAGVDGSAGTPAVQGADPNTGIFYPAADTVAIAAGGSNKAQFGTGSATIDGLTVGRGAGAVATNTAIGASALASTSSGLQNTAIGSNAAQYQTNNNNTALGYNAMLGVSGSSAGGSNTAIGSNSLAGLTTGNFNTALGQQALLSNTTASNNTAVGYQAGYSITTGAGNVIFGQGAGYSLTTGTQNTFVGAPRVGVSGCGDAITTGSKNTIIGSYNGNQGGLDIRTASNRIVLSDGDGNPRLHIDNSGYAYIPAMPVGGTANMHWSSSAGQLFVTSSSRRFKHDIVDYDRGLTALMQMRPKYFVYNDEPNQKQRAGFIAEDFHDLGMTEYVEYWKDDEGNDTPSEIGYSNMVAILVKSIQELKAEVDNLKAQINGASA